VDELLGTNEGAPGRTPGWVFLPPGLDPATSLDLLTRFAGRDDEWSPVLVVERGDQTSLLPLHAGFALRADEFAGSPDDGMSGGAALSFRSALVLLSRVRHDINNALTVALAEVQLVLLDLDSKSEAAASLRVVESQVERIRDLVRDLSAIRAPRH